MIFEETRLQGAYVIAMEKVEDKRGFNARAWCQREFAERGLVSHFVQTNVIFNKAKGTLRGVHYQIAPCEEAKVFRCSRGAIYDVLIDFRPGSPTYRQWVGIELRAADYTMLYVPGGVAKGFITLEDDVEITYQVSQFYCPEHERGVRYDDPAFGIKWPVDVRVISDKDKGWPDYRP